MSEPSIRFYEAGDAQELFEAARESVAELAPWMPWCHPGYQLAEAQAHIAHTAQTRARGEEWSFGVFDGAGRFAGGVGLNRLDRANRSANLGYWIRSSAAGRGLAPAAVRQIARWAFEHTELIRLEIAVSTRNARSLRAAQKAGAQREGILRARIFLHGECHDAAIYALIRPELPAAASPGALARSPGKES